MATGSYRTPIYSRSQSEVQGDLHKRDAICLQKQSLRRYLDAFTRGRIIGKLEEGHSVISVAAEFDIAHSIVSRLWRQFPTNGTAIPWFSSYHPRGTTPADDRYIVLQAKRNRLQTAGEITRHTTQATGRPIYRVLPWPEDCTVVVCLHDALYDKSRFSLSSDSHRILIWRERGSRNHPSNIIEKERGRRLAARTLPPVTIRELRLALQDEWAAMPQQLIDTPHSQHGLML
ncbi:transposable element Tcb1 transposase [Trichonephila clavipes]|nr:transposable element Tcb1 transposase [Trichonephila clavipes]